MKFGDYVKKGWEIIQLKPHAIDSLAGDKDALGPAIGIVAIAGVCAAIGSFNALGIIYMPILAVIFSFIGFGIMHFIATLFDGKGEFRALYAPLGCAYIITWIGIVPLIGPALGVLAKLWVLVVSVVVIERVHKIERAKAIAVVAIILVIGLIIALAAVVAGVSIWAFARR